MQRTRKAKLLAMVVGATTASILSPAAWATDYTWSSTSGGTYAWDLAGNWGGGGYPDAVTDTANTSVLMGGNLLIDLPAAGVQVNKLTLGTTGGALTTDVGHSNFSGGVLTFADNAVNAIIESVGAAGATNIVSAPVRLLRSLDVLATNTNSVTFSGGITVSGANRGLVLLQPVDKPVVVSGTVNLSEPAAAAVRGLTVGSANTANGSATFSGVIQDGGIAGGTLTIGGTSGNSARPTVYLSGTNTYTGTTTFSRGNLIIGNDSAFGPTGTFQGAGQAAAFQRNIISTSDSRTIANNFLLANHFTITGANSIKFTGPAYQSTTRFLICNLEAGKKLTMDGPGFGLASSANDRLLTVGGSGDIDFKNSIYNHRKGFAYPGSETDAGDDIMQTGSITKVGTGVLNLSGTASTYKGSTTLQGGLTQFSTAAAWGATTGIVIHPGSAGALLSTGSTDAGFLAKLTAATAPSSGGLALTSLDAAAALDFTAGALAGANLVNLSVGAAAAGVSYTGTITPAAGGYRLGGGGTLTLPSANALTGARNVTITNGGTVVVTNTNNYTGTTVVSGQYINPTQAQAALLLGDTASVATTRVNTTLSVSNLADGGSDSSIGKSTSAAGNLVLNGGTLRYTGSGGSTDRLFTITPVGATIDASGSGAIVFDNTGAAVSADVSVAVTGDTTTGGTIINAVSDTSRLAVGMTVSGGNLPAGTTITGFATTVSATNVLVQRIRTSADATAAATGAPLTFGAQNRTLTLTGSNTGGNEIAAALGDAASGTLSVSKTGIGHWILSGTKTWTGSTSVSEGTLTFSGNQVTQSSVNVTGGTLELSTGNGGNRVIKTPTVSVSGTGEIDLKDNKLIVTAQTLGSWNGSAYDGVTGQVASGDITSSSTQSMLTGLAIATAGAAGKTSFASISVAASDVLVMFTYIGDANLSGFIDADDYFQIDSNYGKTANSDKSYFTGDFNLDGLLDGDDYQLIDAGFSGQGAPFSPGAAVEGVTAVPEPGVTFIVGAALLLLRRRRRCG